MSGVASAGVTAQKKSLSATEQNEKHRTKFRKFVKVLDLRHCVFVDEMGSNLAMTGRYGRAAPGERVLDTVPGDRGGNVSTIGAIDLTGIRTGLSVPGALDGETMVFFVEELLAPTLQRGKLVFLDNCPIHKRDESEELRDARGAGGVFLPTYSPDLNPIELCWSKVKARLRALKPRTPEAFLDALVEAFATVSVHDILSWFQHCGYQIASI